MELNKQIADIRFLQSLPEDVRPRVLAHARMRRLEKGDAVWHDGEPSDHLSFVASGRVKLVMSNEGGRSTIVDLCQPGSLLCASAPCTFAPHCCDAIAMDEGTLILSLPRRDVFESIERNDAAARALLSELSCRTASLCHRVSEVASGQVERRIATLLLRLARTVGEKPTAEGQMVPARLSRQDLAELCGTTVETTVRVMTRLAREGVVKTVQNGFMIHDAEALEALRTGDA